MQSLGLLNPSLQIPPKEVIHARGVKPRRCGYTLGTRTAGLSKRRKLSVLPHQCGGFHDCSPAAFSAVGKPHINLI